MRLNGIKDFFAIEDKNIRREQKSELKRNLNLEMNRIDGFM